MTSATFNSTCPELSNRSVDFFRLPQKHSGRSATLRSVDNHTRTKITNRLDLTRQFLRVDRNEEVGANIFQFFFLKRKKASPFFHVLLIFVFSAPHFSLAFSRPRARCASRVFLRDNKTRKEGQSTRPRHTHARTLLIPIVGILGLFLPPLAALEIRLACVSQLFTTVTAQQTQTRVGDS